MGPKDESKGEAKALEMAQAASADVSDDEDFDAGFLDFAEHYRSEFKATAPSGFGESSLTTQGNAVPPRFEDVSLCVDCKHCHQVTVPVNVRVPVGESGQRAALGKIRRCLLGLKLPSDDSPEMLSQQRKNVRMAPLAIECSHFHPWSNAELHDMEWRRQEHQERMKERREAQAALDSEDDKETSNV